MFMNKELNLRHELEAKFVMALCRNEQGACCKCEKSVYLVLK